MQLLKMSDVDFFSLVVDGVDMFVYLFIFGQDLRMLRTFLRCSPCVWFKLLTWMHVDKASYDLTGLVLFPFSGVKSPPGSVKDSPCKSTKSRPTSAASTCKKLQEG